MFGVLLAVLASVLALGWSRLLLRRQLAGMDPALELGVCGMIGLGLLATVLMFVGLAPGGLKALPVVEIALLGGVFGLPRKDLARYAISAPKAFEWAAGGAIGISVFFSLTGALAPSTTLDWDSLAYHLAVPKIWLAAGTVERVPFIHHSNFPGAVDGLYVLGLQLGGESMAKAFSVCFMALGAMSLFGLGRLVYGRTAGWWAAVAFATAPIVLWLSGTAYIDVANGLYGGMGIALVAVALTRSELRGALPIGAVLLGLCAGSKYTGLLTLFVAVGLIPVVAHFIRAEGTSFASSARQALLVLALGGGLCLPWYVRNVAWTGNPVYPFFYGRFGGTDWSAFNAAIYSEEQNTFGVGVKSAGGHDPTQIGAAVLGLAYQPGRYTNPLPTEGRGLPLGAIGVVPLVAFLFWLASGKARSFEAVVLANVTVGLLAWFFLSEQSRYIVTYSVPLCLLAGGAASRLRAGPLVALVIALQGVYSLVLVKVLLVDDRLPVVLGKVTPDEYQAQRVEFYAPAQWLNEHVGPHGRVALYDEVFGYYLNVPYFWANPGHCTLIPYGQMANGGQFAGKLADMGFDYVYVNLRMTDSKTAQHWLASMGLISGPPLTAPERAGLLKEPRTKWKVLLADAVADHRLVPQSSGGGWVILGFAK